MDTDEFWTLIDRSREGHERHPEGQAEALKDLLTGRSTAELQAFDKLYREHLVRAYTWDLWAAGYLHEGGMSDDAFEYFIDWLIGQGRAAFEQVLADPDSLADLAAAVPGGLNNESLRYAADYAHEATHDGTELEFADDAPALPEDPAGEPWDEDDVDALEARFPRIAAKVGS